MFIPPEGAEITAAFFRDRDDPPTGIKKIQIHSHDGNKVALVICFDLRQFFILVELQEKMVVEAQLMKIPTRTLQKFGRRIVTLIM